MKTTMNYEGNYMGYQFNELVLEKIDKDKIQVYIMRDGLKLFEVMKDIKMDGKVKYIKLSGKRIEVE